MLQKYWTSTVIFIGIFSPCTRIHCTSNVSFTRTDTPRFVVIVAANSQEFAYALESLLFHGRCTLSLCPFVSFCSDGPRTYSPGAFQARVYLRAKRVASLARKEVYVIPEPTGCWERRIDRKLARLDTSGETRIESFERSCSSHRRNSTEEQRRGKKVLRACGPLQRCK